MVRLSFLSNSGGQADAQGQVWQLFVQMTQKVAMGNQNPLPFSAAVR
jgi:hypothetical protein